MGRPQLGDGLTTPEMVGRWPPAVIERYPKETEPTKSFKNLQQDNRTGVNHTVGMKWRKERATLRLMIKVLVQG